MTRARLLLVAAIVLLVLLAIVGGPVVGSGLRFAFLLASAPPIGAVLLLAIGRLTGADWSALVPVTRLLPWLVPLAVLAMLAGGRPPLPAHLATWQHPLFVAVRAAAALAALGWAGARLRAGAGPTTAGIVLAVYAALVTPIGADWLLANDPGHPVSAIGMMLFTIQFASACAVLLIARAGDGRLRSDLAKLLVAALLGLGYLCFMDYLIVWFGNLPSHVPFYVARTTPAIGSIAVLALLVGLAAPLATLSLMGERGQPWAGRCAMAGLTMAVWWWLGGDLVTLLVGVAVLMLLTAAVRPLAREAIRG